VVVTSGHRSCGPEKLGSGAGSLTGEARPQPGQGSSRPGRAYVIR